MRARQARDGGAGALDDALELAVEQARGLGHSYVGTEHLLLALTAGPTRELARRTLGDMGLKHEQALRGVATALSAYRYARESITFVSSAWHFGHRIAAEATARTTDHLREHEQLTDLEVRPAVDV